jgi:arylsulfatase A-like enzyme
VLAPDRGLARGFDVYDDGALAGVRPPRRRPGNEVVDHALEWLAANGRSRFFLWIHLYDAHAPQRPPEDLRRTYGDSYVGGVAFEDAQIGRMLYALDRSHLRGTTAVIVAGDHGESLGDHGENEHGIFVYESALHVPLIVSTPGVRVGRTHELTSLVDVAPTVMDLFGIRRLRTDGTSLAGVLAGRELADRPIYAESLYALRFGWSPLRAVRDERYKYIDAPRSELYDLENDPFETYDLSATRPDLVATMRAQLIRGFGKDVARANNVDELSFELRERLGALGYTSGPRTAGAGPGHDPKDEIRDNTRQGLLR